LQTHADEPRLAAIGYSGANRILFVVVVEVSHETVRIISARKATRSERKDYEAQQRRR
jgi:uncharacterized protein